VKHLLVAVLGCLALACASLPVQSERTAATVPAQAAPAEEPPCGYDVVVPDWLVDGLAQVKLPEPADYADAPCRKPIPLRPLEALGAGGALVVRCCEQDHGTFSVGCMDSRQCVYHVRTDSGWQEAAHEPALAAILGPPRSNAEAVGRIALATRVDLVVKPPRTRVADDYRGLCATLAPLSATEATASQGGFSVHVATTEYCSCIHPLELRHFDVTAAGVVEEKRERRVLLTESERICRD
jgi:hypothetical protein